jgi:hypothetical protein
MSELKKGTVYLIRHKEEKWHHFEGTFKEYTYTNLGYNNVLYPTFKNVIRYYTINPITKKEHDGDYNYYKPTDNHPHMDVFLDFRNITFYDAEKVKNGKKAIQKRERRTVNMILRRLIGDECFEW